MWGGVNSEVTDGTVIFKIYHKALMGYPIGAIYQSMVSTSPATMWGGKWTQIVDRFIYCADSSKVLGGEAEHTLTVDEMPSHNHEVRYMAGYTADTDWVGANGTAKAVTRSSDFTGGSQPHNNMPPYITAYAWYRIE